MTLIILIASFLQYANLVQEHGLDEGCEKHGHSETIAVPGRDRVVADKGNEVVKQLCRGEERKEEKERKKERMGERNRWKAIVTLI